MADLRCSYWRPDPPDLENRAMGFFWGVDRDCLVPVDRGSDKQTFFCAFQKINRENLHRLFGSPISHQSIGRGRISR